MADEINYLDINEKFPIAGKDNDSQVFRNNFTIIKENWKLTKDIVTALSTNAAQLNQSNDFKGNEILNAVLAHYNKKVDSSRINGERGDLTGSVIITPEDGPVQIIRALRNLTLKFDNWADGTYYQEIRLLLLTDGGPRRCDLVNINGPIYTNNPDGAYAIPDSVSRAYIVDVFTYDGGNTVQCYIYTDYSGLIDDGTIGGGGGTTLDDIKGILPLPDFYENEGSTDSASGVIGTPIFPNNNPTQPTNRILVGTGDIGKFFEGQTIRISGGSGTTFYNNEGAVVAPLATTGLSITSIGYPEGTVEADFGTPDQLDNLKYRLHYIDFSTCNTSAGVENTELSINANLGNFSSSNFINIVFNRSQVNYGVLVYRSVNDGEYKLIDVLGPKQLGSTEADLTYQDYAAYSFVDWSKKTPIIIQDGLVTNPNNVNVYGPNTGVETISIISNNTGSIGFIDATIASVQLDPPIITLTNSYYFKSTVNISVNDTQKLQTEIEARVEKGVNYLKLSDRTYNVSQLVLPNNFTLQGSGRNTVIKKLSWSNENNLGIFLYPIDAENITIKDLNIDGNQQNQYLRTDETNGYENYAIQARASQEVITGEIDPETGETYIPPNNLNFLNIVMHNIRGGGIWAPYVDTLRVQLSVIEDQGLDDIWDYSPLIANSCTDLMVNGNKFKNFAGSVDVLTSDTGVINGNIIKNCGSGLSVFGSRFLTTSPNTIVGPNNEFIWGPDIYNSDYDSVNLFLTRDSRFISDVYKYQENGVNFDLTPNGTTIPLTELTARLYRLDKGGDGAETLSSEIFFESLTQSGIFNRRPLQIVTDSSLDAAQGEFRFVIENDAIDSTLSDVNKIIDQYNVTTLKQTFPNHVGLVYQVIFAEYVKNTDLAPNAVLLPSGTTIVYTSGSTYSVSIGAKVRSNGVGAVETSTNISVDNLVGTVTNINSALGPGQPVQITVSYGTPLTVTNGAGSQIVVTNGYLTTQNSFVLAKGRVQ